MNTLVISKVEEPRYRHKDVDFRVGDTLRLGLKVKDPKEGERIQYFQGILIRVSGSGLRQTLTVRKIGANSIGVEKIIPLHSPVLDSIEVVKRSKVRRARLYYMRDRVGKSALNV